MVLRVVFHRGNVGVLSVRDVNEVLFTCIVVCPAGMRPSVCGSAVLLLCELWRDPVHEELYQRCCYISIVLIVVSSWGIVSCVCGIIVGLHSPGVRDFTVGLYLLDAANYVQDYRNS